MNLLMIVSAAPTAFWSLFHVVATWPSRRRDRRIFLREFGYRPWIVPGMIGHPSTISRRLVEMAENVLDAQRPRDVLRVGGNAGFPAITREVEGMGLRVAVLEANFWGVHRAAVNEGKYACPIFPCDISQHAKLRR